MRCACIARLACAARRSVAARRCIRGHGVRNVRRVRVRHGSRVGIGLRVRAREGDVTVRACGCAAGERRSDAQKHDRERNDCAYC